MRKTCNFSEIFCKACVFMSMCLGLLASGWGFLELFSKFLCVWKKGFDSWELGEYFWRVKWVLGVL